MPAGRPTKYKPDMPERVRALLSEGYSKEACAGALGIGERTFYEWQEAYPQFSQAIKEGEKLSQKWWEDKGRQSCADPENGIFNATVWVMQMKNRFGWKDAKQLDGKLAVKHGHEDVSEVDAWLAGINGTEEKEPDTPTRTH